MKKIQITLNSVQFKILYVLFQNPICMSFTICIIIFKIQYICDIGNIILHNNCKKYRKNSIKQYYVIVRNIFKKVYVLLFSNTIQYYIMVRNIEKWHNSKKYRK